jgi:hypothetical protein
LKIPLLLTGIRLAGSRVMRYETSVDSRPVHSLGRDLSSAITFDDIKPSDKVVIRTENSEYRLSVIDPASHKGMLTGGTIGDEPREAFLIKSTSKGEDGDSRDFSGLRIGARALFYLSSDDRIERVVTSKISSLTVVKAEERPSFVS